MHDWQQLLRSLVTIGKADTFPLLVFSANRLLMLPGHKLCLLLPLWVVAICDGGIFADYNFHGLDHYCRNVNDLPFKADDGYILPTTIRIGHRRFQKDNT